MSETKKKNKTSRLLAGVMTPALALAAGPQAPAQTRDPLISAQLAPDPQKRDPRAGPRGTAPAAPQHAPHPMAPPQQPALRPPAPIGAAPQRTAPPAARPPAAFGYPAPQTAPRPAPMQARPMTPPPTPAAAQPRQPFGQPPGRRQAPAPIAAPAGGMHAPIGAPTIDGRPKTPQVPAGLGGPHRAAPAVIGGQGSPIGSAPRAPAPVQPGDLRRAPGRGAPGVANPGVANPGVANPGLAAPGLVPPGPVPPGPVPPGPVAPGPVSPGRANAPAAPAPTLGGADRAPDARPVPAANGAPPPGAPHSAHGGPPAASAGGGAASAPAGALRHTPDDAAGRAAPAAGAPTNGASAGGANPPGGPASAIRHTPDAAGDGRPGGDSGTHIGPGNHHHLGTGNHMGAPGAGTSDAGGRPAVPPAAGAANGPAGGTPFLPGQHGPGGNHAGSPAMGGANPPSPPPGAPAIGEGGAPGAYGRFRHGPGGAPGAQPPAGSGTAGGPPPIAPPPRRGGGSGLSPAAAAAIGAAAGLVGGFMLAQPGVARVDQIHAHRRQFDQDGYTVIEEPGRTIIRDPYGVHIRHDENERFRDLGVDLRSERRGDEFVTVYPRRDGGEVVTFTDANGVLIRRVRRFPDGREIILIDNSFRGPPGGFVDEVVVLPPPPVEIPRERYVVDYGAADQQVVYEALTAPPVAPVPRRYTLDEVRASPSLRAYTRSVDIDTITFDSGSWAVAPDQAQRLSVIAAALNEAIRRNPSEVYLIEGHTDAVGPDVDNLSLSDRRAQSVATLLTRDFDVPAENLTTQGYGEQFPKVQTAGPARENRRVTVRRITPLLSDQQSSASGR